MKIIRQIELAKLAKVSRAYISQLVQKDRFNLENIGGVVFIVNDFKVSEFLKTVKRK
jgi:transcriptional regulator with XRE-family HTH domain